MTPLRVVLISRRYWPLVGGAETAMAALAAELQRSGHRATVLTAQWSRSWPTEIVQREVRVQRLPRSALPFWGTFRYMRALRQWLERQRSEYDLVYVSMLQHEAYAALGQLAGAHAPVVLRAEGIGATGDVAWQRSANFGRRIRLRCQRAAAIVAPGHAIAAELLAEGYAASQVCEIANGVEIPEPRSPRARREAREILAEVNPALALPLEAPLAVFTGRLHEAKGLRILVEAFTQVLVRFPSARLWLVGEGPQQAELAAHVAHLGWSHRIFLPGAFDDVSDVLAAADLFVLPSPEEGMSWALLEAMAAGLPVVACDIPGNRQLVEHGQHGWLVPPFKAAVLADEIVTVLATPGQSSALGQAARDRVTAHFSLARCGALHVELFRRVLAQQQTPGS